MLITVAAVKNTRKSGINTRLRLSFNWGEFQIKYIVSYTVNFLKQIMSLVSDLLHEATFWLILTIIKIKPQKMNYPKSDERGRFLEKKKLLSFGPYHFFLTKPQNQRILFIDGRVLSL